MKYVLKENIKIREEDGFFLMVNLTTEDMLNGYPSFFRVNSSGVKMLQNLRAPISLDSLAEKLLMDFPNISSDQLVDDVNSFVQNLIRYSLVKVIN